MWADYNPGVQHPTNSPRHNPPSIRSVETEADFQAALVVRFAVFVDEQGVPRELEHDAADATAAHVIAKLDGAVIGTGRLVEIDGAAVLGRIAVMPAHRRQGIASLLIAALEGEARQRGYRDATLHAQTYVQELYVKSGYAVFGVPFVEAGIDHVSMIKSL
jgi:predicted GNAT family N-acyltransferase